MNVNWIHLNFISTFF